MEFTSIEHAKAIAYAVSQIKKERMQPRFNDEKFPAQNKFVDDTSPLQAAQCSRRAGKSMGVGKKQLKECFKFPGSDQLYIGLTFATVRNIMWKPIFTKLNTDLNLGGKPNESRLEINFPNGSAIKMVGADADPKQMEKFLGGSYRSCVIDEAGSFRQNLHTMVYEMLMPAVADWNGWIALTGTPTELTRGLFFDVTNGKYNGWSVHKWNTYDNPYMADKWDRQIELLKKDNPRVEETPFFKRMYLNQWVIDDSSLCYKYDWERNDIAKIPHNDPMIHVLGIDLGFTDPTAFAVLAYGEYDPNCYIIHTHKKAGMIISDVADRITYYIQKYNPVAMVIDNASKQAVEELRQKFSLPLIAAEKQGKPEFIEIMNSDFIMGTIKLLPETEELKKEYGGLIWDKDKLPRRKEHPNCENHICFTAGTKIRTPKGLVNIETLKVGDLVNTRAGAKRIKHAITRKERVIKLTLSNGVEIECTEDHPFFSDGQWVKAKDLKETDRLYSWKFYTWANTIPVHFIHRTEITYYPVDVFNITVDEQHEYFANDILVSNCDAALYAFRFCQQYRHEKRAKPSSEEERIDAWFEDQAEDLNKSDQTEYWER